jgi:hypothetical protein
MAIPAGGKNIRPTLIPHCAIESADDTHQYDYSNRLKLKPGSSYPEGDFSNLDNDLPITIF